MRVLIKLLCVVGLGVLIAYTTSNLPNRFAIVKKGNLYYSGFQSMEFRKRVVIIDTGLIPKLLKEEYMCKDYAQISHRKSLYPNALHGTTITSIISKNIDKDNYCITLINLKEGDSKSPAYVSFAYKLIHKLSSVRYVNMSYRWPKYNHDDYLEIKKGIENGITYIAAAGNEALDIGSMCMIYPACYAVSLGRERTKSHPNSNYLRSNFKIIGAIARYSNYGSVVDSYLTGTPIGKPASSGTSMATAEYTGLMVRK